MRYLFSILSTASLAAAHGYVSQAVIGGQTYEFYNPNTDPYMNPTPQRISRAIPGNGPVEDVSSIDVECNGYSAGGQVGSSPAPLHAPAAAGSTVSLTWTTWPESHMGPILTYMARCPAAGCQDWQPDGDAVWFKIQEEGREGSSDNWASVSITPSPYCKIVYKMTYILIQDAIIDDEDVAYTIPSCIPAGYYLVRHETIALHAAYAYPGAQFYPGCHQLEVTGGGSTSPSGLVSFPGAYSSSDPGVVYDAYKGETC